MKVEMGTKVKDRITGFAGMVTGRTEYITGCNQILVQPEVKKDGGDFVEARWIDEDRLEVQPGDVFRLKVEAPGPDKPAPIR